MKKLTIVVVLVVMLAGWVWTPVLAASSEETALSSSCGDTYTVQRGDYLSRIAINCGTTLSSILALNPQIVNRNRIYPGQMIRLTESGTYSVPQPPPYSWWYGYGGPYYPYTYWYSSPRVSLSATRVYAGGSLTVYARGFPVNTEIDFRLGKQGADSSVIVDGRTDSSGYASATMTIPSGAGSGEYWLVHVITTSGVNGAQANSPWIYIR